jgi:hypothetical protein
VAKGVRHMCRNPEQLERLGLEAAEGSCEQQGWGAWRVPVPKDRDLRRRNTPLTKKVRLPRANTNGRTVNLVSEGEKTQ